MSTVIEEEKLDDDTQMAIQNSLMPTSKSPHMRGIEASDPNARSFSRRSGIALHSFSAVGGFETISLGQAESG